VCARARALNRSVRQRLKHRTEAGAPDEDVRLFYKTD